MCGRKHGNSYDISWCDATKTVNVMEQAGMEIAKHESSDGIMYLINGVILSMV